MIKYIVKRLATGVVTMFFLITITFWLTRLMPGSPFATDNISPSVLATLEANYGFDKPIDQQFVIYLQSLLQGNLGVSYTRTGVTVNDLIAQGFPVTLKLGLISFAIALVIGTVIRKCFGSALSGAWLADVMKGRAMAARWGVRKLPALALFRDECFLGAAEGLDTWEGYLTKLGAIARRTEPPQRTISILTPQSEA